MIYTIESYIQPGNLMPKRELQRRASGTKALAKLHLRRALTRAEADATSMRKASYWVETISANAASRGKGEALVRFEDTGIVVRIVAERAH